MMHFGLSYNLRWKINLLHICDTCFLRIIEIEKKPHKTTKNQQQMIYLLAHAFVQSWIIGLTFPCEYFTAGSFGLCQERHALYTLWVT